MVGARPRVARLRVFLKRQSCLKNDFAFCADPDALALGPLQNKDFDLPEETIQRITELTPKGVPVEASILLFRYYIAINISQND